MFIPANDHRPAHVHVVKAGNEAVFFLNCPDGPASLRENYGLKAAQLNAIERVLNPKCALRQMGSNPWSAVKRLPTPTSPARRC
ncbi:MAG: DUF4160 domain-containing protein [Hyphomonadaceae bacterium]